MSFRVHIDTIGLEDLQAEFRDMAARGENPKEAFEGVVDDFLDLERKAFSTRGSSQGKQWKALSPRYLKRKKGPGILREKGKLYDSLTHKTSAGGIREIDRTSVTMGTRDKKANLHQQNRNPGKGRLPRREVIHITKADGERWVGLVADYVINRQRSRGLR